MANTYYEKDVFFLPQDFENLLTKKELEDALTEIILEIRANNRGKYTQVKEKLNELQKYRMIDFNKASVGTLLNIYHKIIDASLELRKLLNQVFNSIDTYDHINYAFYINGKRYFTETINTNWVSKNDKGGLDLNLTQARKALQSTYQRGITEKIRNIFNKHYDSYYNMISGTYKGKNGIGQSGMFNLGTVAEAFEEHLNKDHDPDIIRLLNQSRSFRKDDPIVLEIQNKEKELTGYWAEHESVEKGWMHIRSSKGKMRGTVGGDVFNTQVKQTKDSSGSVQLASLDVLIDGTILYCSILEDSIPPKNFVKKLVTYMSEPLDKKGAIELAKVGNDMVKEKLNLISDKEVLIHI